MPFPSAGARIRQVFLILIMSRWMRLLTIFSQKRYLMSENHERSISGEPSNKQDSPSLSPNWTAGLSPKQLCTDHKFKSSFLYVDQANANQFRCGRMPGRPTSRPTGAQDTLFVPVEWSLVPGEIFGHEIRRGSLLQPLGQLLR